MNKKTVPCKNCRTRIAPTGNSSLNQYCDKEECQNVRIRKALEKGRQKINKEWNEYRNRVKPVTHAKEYKKNLQLEVNRLSRMIDEKFGYHTCIDCGKSFGTQCDAAHFHSTGSNHSLTYNLHNLHSASSQCNQFSDKHHSGYITGLAKRYGSEYLEMVQNLGLKYPSIKLSAVEVVEKLKIVRKLIRDFNTFKFENAIEARTQLNNVIGIYK